MIIIYRITASQKELILFWKQIHCGWSQAILAGIKRPCIDDVMLSCHADLSCCSVDCHYGVSLIQIAFLHGMSLLRTNIMYIPWGATSPPAGGILTVAVLSPPTVGPALNSSWITRWFMLQSHAVVGNSHDAEKYTNLVYMFSWISCGLNTPRNCRGCTLLDAIASWQQKSPNSPIFWKKMRCLSPHGIVPFSNFHCRQRTMQTSGKMWATRECEQWKMWPLWTIWTFENNVNMWTIQCE